MVKNRSKKTWRSALILLLVLVILGGVVIAYQNGTFVAKGTELNILGKREFISPGELLYCENGYNGIWSLYQKSNETVLTYTDNNGSRQWQHIYDTSRLLTHSDYFYSITGNLVDPEVNIINTLGKIVWSWEAPGKLLLCRINDQGQTFIYHELTDSQNQSSWVNRMSLFNISGQEIWHTDYTNTEILDFVWLQNNFAVLTYTVTAEEQKQTLTVYSQQGDILWQKNLDKMVTDLTASNLGDKLLWLTSDEACLLQLDTGNTTTIPLAEAVACGFASSDTLFFIFDQTGWPGLDGYCQLEYTDLQGTTKEKKRYSGHFTDYKQLPDSTLVVATTKGVFGTLPDQALWHVLLEQDVIQIAVEVNTNTLFVFTNDNAQSWYQITSH